MLCYFSVVLRPFTRSRFWPKARGFFGSLILWPWRNSLARLQGNWLRGSAGFSSFIPHPPLFCRRDGPLWLTSEVTLITLPVNATPSDSCTADGGDYCPMAVRVMFGLGQSTANVSVVIFDDDEAEGPETFRVMLTTPINATLPRSRLSTALVTIMDAVDDCKSAQRYPILQQLLIPKYYVS